jgi:hypothetical protein
MLRAGVTAVVATHRSDVSDERALGAGDCEAWRERGLGQPTNTVTSLGYVAAGAWLLARTRVVRPEQRWRAGTYGLALAASGVGSVAYHGWGGRFAHWLHDATLAALVAALPVEQLASVRGWEAGRATSTLLLATAPALVHLAVDPDASAPSTGVLVAAAALGEADRARRGTTTLPPAQRDEGRRRVATALVGVTAAVGAYVLGRTSAPTCRPTSRWQWHGVWHVLGAAAAATWSDRVHVLPHLAAPPDDARRPRARPRPVTVAGGGPSLGGSDR